MAYEIKTDSVIVVNRQSRTIDLTAGERTVKYQVCEVGDPKGLCKHEFCTIDVVLSDTLANIQTKADNAASTDFTTKYS